MFPKSKPPYNEPTPQEYAEYLKWREKVGSYLTAAYLTSCIVLTIVAGFLLLG